MRRFARLSSILSLAICGSSQAVVLYGFDTNGTTGNPASHSTAPTGTFANSGWQYQGQFSAFSGTAIGPHTFITAAHVAPGGGVFTYNGNSYTITGSTTLANRDLAVVTVSGTLPYWAPIYNESTDGALTGRTLVDMGRGTQRGDPINVSTSRTGEGTLRGWVWGPADSVQRWGTNVVTGFYADNTAKEYVTFNFDQNGLTDEATISGGDSGGGMFVKANDGVWKLVGVNSFVSPAGFRYQANTPTTPVDPLPSSAFDYRDLYIQANDGTYHLAQDFAFPAGAIPQTNYINNVTDVPTSTLATYVPHAGDVNADGKVNALDFNVVASNFGLSSGAIWTQGDMNFDGKVNATDFTILATNFGYSGAAPDGAIGSSLNASAVPEPSMASALALCLLGLRRRR
jgi:dockerin type I repeat protein/trypsin